ncbi:hypothetical protein ABL78_1240 [Leptomonas seymouri]|uniref:Uncharacterized protein n=1 Tax=Leptomonas seymouri TaxID=5684 RepID=A0A0N0P884_LEPSE|nr:hypothetical protein ABL78_1240 [Leptomonas seymouri]|eukprot:KPI89659.1 hypothetical protein ABL78_1240 [Leptomonas seymouri]
MKRRTLFLSDSGVSDDDVFLRRQDESGGSTHRPNAVLVDPRFTSAVMTEAAAPSAPTAGLLSESQRPQPYSATNISDGLLPQSSKVMATRHNLSQVFGEGLSSAPKPSSTSSAVPSAAAGAAAASRTSVDTAIPSALSSSSWPAPSAANIAETFFAPRFTYDGPNSSSTLSSRDFHHINESGTAGLTTVLQAVVQAYRDELYCNTCLLALCVPTSSAPANSGADNVTSSSSVMAQQLPPSAAARERLQRDSQQRQHASSSPSASPGPMLLLLSANRQVLCKVPLDQPEAVLEGGCFQLHQDREQPQYIAFLSASPSASGTGSRSNASPDPASTTCWWTCMFPDRAKALLFLVATYTVAQYAAALTKRAGTFAAAVPTVRVLPRPPSSPFCKKAGGSRHAQRGVVHADEKPSEAAAMSDDSAAPTVQAMVPTTVHWSTWALRRVSGTSPYCLPAECVDGAPPSSPRDVTPGSGALRDGLEAALVGMRSGELRLVFMAAEETRVRHPELTSPSFTKSAPTPPSSPSARQRGHHRDDAHTQVAELHMLDVPAVAFVMCVNAVSTTAPVVTGVVQSPALLSSQPDHHQQQQLPSNPRPCLQTESTGPVSTTAATAAAATSALLQQLLLNALQPPQQAHGAPLPVTAAPPPLASDASPPPSPKWDAMERSLDRVMLQLGSLYEKVDRLDIEGNLRRNNVELERAMKRVAGLAPQAVAAEDTLKDRDALLASVERYRQQYEEASANYQRALEAMGRSMEKVQALERDLQVQQNLWTRQRHEAAEQTRLQLLERDVQHRAELERVAEERYTAGKSDGHAAGYHEGRQATLTAVDGEGGVSALMAEWKEKVMMRDQQIVALQALLQDAKHHHERDRRQLRAEIDVLTDLNEKLQHIQSNADVRMPEETAQQQCKRVKRTLNSVYAQVEAQLLMLPRRSQASGNSEVGEACLVSIDDALAVIMTAIRSEAQSAVAQIRADAERRAKENGDVRALTLARQHTQRPTVAYAESAVADLEKEIEYSSGIGAPHRGSAAGATATSTTTITNTVKPPLQHSASNSDLAAVTASLLPEVVDVTATFLVNNGASTDEQFSVEKSEGHVGASHRNPVRVVAEESLLLLKPTQAERNPGAAKSPVQCLAGNTCEAAWPSSDMPEQERRGGESSAEGPQSALTAQNASDVERGGGSGEGHRSSPKAESPPSSATASPSSASPLEAASRLFSAQPSRRAMRLPDLPPSTLSTAAVPQDKMGWSPPEMTGTEGLAENAAGMASSFRPSGTRHTCSSGEAASSLPSSDIVDSTPSLHDVHSRRLFTTPPSFTKPSFEQPSTHW